MWIESTKLPWQDQQTSVPQRELGALASLWSTLWWTNSLLWKDPPFFMGKSTMSMAIFNSYLYVHQRVTRPFWVPNGVHIQGTQVVQKAAAKDSRTAHSVCQMPASPTWATSARHVARGKHVGSLGPRPKAWPQGPTAHGAEVQCSKIAERSARPTCSPQNFDPKIQGLDWWDISRVYLWGSLKILYQNHGLTTMFAVG